MTLNVTSSAMVASQFFMQSVFMSVSNFCPPRQDEKQMCYREGCIQMADDILEKMDTSIHPCQNFYQYSCGRWLNRQFLNSHRKRATTFVNDLPWHLIRKFLAEAPKPTDLIAEQKAKAFYTSCVNYGGIYYSRRFEDLDPLHFLKYKEGIYNIEFALIKAIQLGVHPLFELRADPSSFTDPEKRQQRSNLYVSKPVLGMDYNRYKVLVESKMFRDKYARELLHDLSDAQIYLMYKADFSEYVQEHVDVEITFAMMYNNLTNKGTTVNMTLEQLDADYGQFMNWTRVVSELTSSLEVGITDITPQEVVIVRDPVYLRGIFDYFAALPERTKAGYFITRVFDSLEYADLEEHDKADVFLTDSGKGSTSFLDRYRAKLLRHRELRCVKQTSQIFDLVVYRFLYLNDTIRTVQSISRKMALRFAAIVNSLDWMSTNTKDKIVDKVVSTEAALSFIANAMNDSLLESYYSSITGDTYLEMLVRARKAAFVRDIKNIRRTREADPPSFPHQFMTQYSRELNKIYINPVFLREPFFNIGYEPLNFAGFGSVLAQEMMHGYDTQGIRYNTDRAEGNWLSEREVQIFNEGSQCLIDQYNNYTYRPAGMQVNGTLTLDSNIADAIGLKLAYHAYSKSRTVRGDTPLLPGVPLTYEQLFFVKSAQLRCTKENAEAAISTMSGKQSPDEFRVNGPLRNLEEFATVFGCPADSYMNPSNKCKLW
ncbi:hypothetical protein BsWGS_17233 [Bradybaena similaris]